MKKARRRREVYEEREGEKGSMPTVTAMVTTIRTEKRTTAVAMSTKVRASMPATETDFVELAKASAIVDAAR